MIVSASSRETDQTNSSGELITHWNSDGGSKQREKGEAQSRQASRVPVELDNRAC